MVWRKGLKTGYYHYGHKGQGIELTSHSMKKPLHHFFIFILLSVGVVHSSAQEAVPDSIPTPTPVKESQGTVDVDTTISYEAHVVDNILDEHKTFLVGNALVKYKNINLQAEKITLDWDNNMLIAEGIPDTVWKKTSNPHDSIAVVEWKGTPVLNEGGTQTNGFQIRYNYKTEKGIMVRGRTDLEGGKYFGTQIKKVDNKVFNASYGTYTTCDREEDPHFHFAARRMKMIINDKVIAKPIIMYIGNIPVAALPFAIFPHRTGRHSGLIVPRYGESAREGRYLRGLGYYWAPNDYFDAQATVDYYDKSGWLFRGGMNYAVRYNLSGSISGSLTRKNFASAYSSGYKDRRWDLRISHNQTIDPNTRLVASGNFISDTKFYNDLSANLSTRLRRELRSNATFSKNWPKHKLSLSANASQVHNLDNDITHTTFPQLTFRKGQAQIFKPKEDPRDRRRSGRRAKKDAKWYHSIYYGYNSSLLNSMKENLKIVNQDTTKERTTTRRINHNLSFSMSSPKKYFGWLNLNQSAGYKEDWFDETDDYYWNQETGQIDSRKVKGFAARRTFNYSATATTKLYGLVAPNIWDIRAIRHVVTPSVTFSYQPDFSEDVWGYFQTITDTTGKSYQRDRFGGTPSGGTKRIGLGVRNLFQMKTGEGENERKADLFSLDFNTGFNFKAKQYKMSDISSSLRASPLKNFSLSANTMHSVYRFDPVKNSKINRYIVQDGGWRKGDFLRLTSFRFNASLRLQGRTQSRKKESAADSLGITMMGEELEGVDYLEREEEMSVLEEAAIQRGDRFEPDEVFRGIQIPWRVNLTFSYSLSKSNPNRTQRRYYVDISGAEVKLTRNWRIGYRAHYDIKEKLVTSHQFTFHRDLHCWEAQFIWVPSGPYKRFYFRINIKATHLRDIKLERGGGGGSRVYGY
jgi:lipopolysaccharide assembly outer membrane protein LptD (OstA)